MSLLGYFKNLIEGSLIVADEEANVVLGPEPNDKVDGSPHYTVSARLGDMRREGSQFACWACNALTWISNRIGFPTKDHCTDALAKVEG